MPSIGIRLKLLRRNKKMTLDKLADRFNDLYDVNIHKGLLSRYENNIITPSRDTLIMYSKFFNISLDYILGINAVDQSILDEEEELDISKLSLRKKIELDTIINMTSALFCKDNYKMSEEDKKLLNNTLTKLYLNRK